MTSKKVLFEMPVPSYTLLPGGPTIPMESGRRFVVRCDFENIESGRRERLSLVFDGIEAFKQTNYLACDIELIQKAYERVVDLGESEWLLKVRSNLAASRASTPGDLRHVGIFFDDGPSLEFICSEFRTELENLQV
jgi:hypothetical protein